MTEPPTTQVSLLLRLRDANDNEAWQYFMQLYAPLVYQYARKHHLQDADAADVTQEVLQSVSKAIGQLDYDPQRGSFRGWLFTLAHHRLCDFLTRQKRQTQGSGDSKLHKQLDEMPAAEDDVWQQEYEKQLFRWAAGQIRGEFTEKTWQAFWQTAVEGLAIKDVADQLGLSLGAMYVARTRVQARLKEKIQEVSGD